MSIFCRAEDDGHQHSRSPQSFDFTHALIDSSFDTFHDEIPDREALLVLSGLQLPAAAPPKTTDDIMSTTPGATNTITTGEYG